MDKTDVLIIGAGATGLMAAYKLARQGKKVTLLEARGRIGGRIHTVHNGAFFDNAELGAEFIHGDLPVTINLLKEAGIAYNPASGEMVRFVKGKFADRDEFIEGWDELLAELSKLEQDTGIVNFLHDKFGGDEYEGMRESVWKFVSGYDTADPRQASAFALRREWQSEDEGAQHRITGGYGAMINYLADEIKANAGAIHLNSTAREITWEKEYVRVVTSNDVIYTAGKIIIALPLGVLQAHGNELGSLAFYPAIPGHIKAIKAMGFGAVIKFLLNFDEAFWLNAQTEKLAGRDLGHMGYLLSDEKIPTWWTQYSNQSPLLTGWLGGPAAEAEKLTSTEGLLEMGLESLSHIFNISAGDLKTRLKAWQIVNWTAEPFTRGSYSYDTVAAAGARKILKGPINGTIFFAGEYLYEGPAMGTVEAALTSGEDAAGRI